MRSQADIEELPGEGHQNPQGDDQAVARKPRGRPRKSARGETAGSDAPAVAKRQRVRVKKPSLAIPARPPLQEYEPEDGRKFAVLPAKAITDKNITRQALRVLALICLHVNRNGFTWIGAQKMADLMGCTTAAIGQQMMQLKALGYVEEVAAPYYGGPTARTATIRVVYDRTLSAEDVLARDSGRDDKWGQIELSSNSPEKVSVLTSLKTEVVKQGQDLTPAELAIVHRYRAEGLEPPTGSRLAFEASQIKA